jgi:A/G-specific adenine glycosylase
MRSKKLLLSEIKKFQKTIYDFYNKNRRDFAWRQTTNPYRILVSEIMLQQTQTERVKTKYIEFLTAFPNFKALAEAPLSKLLSVWQGMGYNRRALSLQDTARRVVNEFKGKLPSDPAVLITLKGIGPNTAGSIAAFAFNSPTIFIETNIRTVFIHYFFPHTKEVHDDELLPLIEQTLDKTNPREWYYALMDYGVHLKKLYKNPSRRSKHHTKQSKFEGSDRQIRGAILKTVIEEEKISLKKLYKVLERFEEGRVKKILEQLLKEKFLQKEKDIIFIK